MHKKIYIAVFFISILVVAQLSTATVFIDTNHLNQKNLSNDCIIQLTDAERNRLETSIENISDNTLRNQLQSLLSDGLDDENRINTDSIQQLFDILSTYQPPNLEEIYDFMDLIEAIIEIIVAHLLELPSLIVQALLYDVVMIAQKTAAMVVDVMSLLSSETFADVFSAITSLFSDFNRLLYHVRQLPRNMDDLKVYIEEKITATITFVLEKITTEVTTVVWEFSEPRLGYISKFGVEIYDALLVSEELYEHLTFKLEHFKVIFIDLPTAYLEFKDADEEHMVPTLVNFSLAILDAIGSAQTLLYDFMDNETEVIDDITELMDHLTYLNDYYSSQPWALPITINGTVVNAGSNEVQISFIDEQQADTVTVSGDNASFMLSFDPSKTENPASLHTFTIIATNGEETLEFNRSAFSDGWVDMKIDFDDDDSDESIQHPRFVFFSHLEAIIESINVFMKNKPLFTLLSS